jgi:hypothetical protein
MIDKKTKKFDDANVAAIQRFAAGAGAGAGAAAFGVEVSDVTAIVRENEARLTARIKYTAHRHGSARRGLERCH